MTFSKTQRSNLYQQLTNNTSTNNIAFGNTLMNQFDMEYVHAFPAVFEERTDTSIMTQPSVQYYTMLNSRVRRIKSVTVRVGNFNWTPSEAPTINFWNQVNIVGTPTTPSILSDIPIYYYYYNGQIGLYPTPAGGYNTVTVRYETEPVPLTLEDVTTTVSAVPYILTLTGSLASGAVSATLSTNFLLTTGTYEITFSNGNRRLATCTLNSTAITFPAITATATTSIIVRTQTGGDIFTCGTVPSEINAGLNLYVQIGQTTGTTSGDGTWYKVDTGYTSTIFSITQKYQGASLAGATTALTFGQMSIIAEPYQILPVYRAVEQYYSTIAPDLNRAKTYKNYADELFAQMKFDYGNKNDDPTVSDTDRPIINPNLTISQSLT